MLVLFIVSSLVVFFLSLYFMTDFKDLFGLRLKVNKDVAFFHDVLMQDFNRLVFWFALGSLVVVFIAFCLEVNRFVPDLFAVVVMVSLLGTCAALALYSVLQMPRLESIYRSLDFSNVDVEGAVDYQVRTTTFTIMALCNAVHAAICVVFSSMLVASHVQCKGACHDKT